MAATRRAAPQLIFTQHNNGLVYTAGDRANESEPYFTIRSSAMSGVWALRGEFGANPIAIGQFRTKEEAFTAAQTVYSQFLARRGRSGIRPEHDKNGNCRHAGTVTENGIQICDHCHRRTTGVYTPF
ncbi:hypothetical protein AB0C34_17395 [Nocardia sp. NPDC049220]|uniref:hypothetical protein n=1 Tax=Nocardia sp. NPDC049220 TaxID=3155273 RepID=UPI0033E84BFD